MSVLVGFAPTPEGRAAVRRAVTECRLRGADLVVVNSERDPTDAGSHARCEAEVKIACDELGVEGLRHEVRQGINSFEPADDLLAVAEETGAQLIVIGLRRRTPVGKLILGGNAQRVLLDASCPVLAVKADAQP